MGWFIHHVNVQAYNVRESAAFYQDVIGLKEGVWSYPEKTGKVGHNADSIAPFGLQNRGIHVVKAIQSFPLDNNLFHNPTIGGHFAITVPDADAVKARLEGAGYLVSDAGMYAMAGMRQIYAYDPCQTVMEFNEAVDGDAAGRTPRDGEAHDLEMQEGGWSIHHVNLPAHDVRETAAYLTDLVGLEETKWDTASGSPVADYVADPSRLAIFGEDNRGIHVVKPTPDFAERCGFKHNPTIGGHFALTVPDLGPVKQRMEAAGIQYTDAGAYAMAGLAQVYAFDPSMNLVEINQIV